MPDLNAQPDKPELERALEKTASAEDFSAEAVRREMKETASDHTPEETAQQYLRRTASEGSRLDASDIVATASLTSFDSSETIVPGTATESAQPGQRRFEIMGEIGHGATSRVYGVRDHSLGRVIAVKLLRRSRDRKGTVSERFIHEARVTAMLEHPNIMPIHDIGSNERNQLYFTMKNIAGVSLGDAIRAARDGGTVPDELSTVDGRVRVFLKVCDALSFAHSRGFVHQDVKPDNIMIGEHGEVLLLDWGSALSHEEAVHTTGKALYGTPAYMSPEQARREHADERSDVYCLGATFFHALLLRHPVWADDPESFWGKKRAGTLDFPTDLERRHMPPALLDIALKAMAPDPARRYQTVDQFADELKRWQAGQAVRAHHETLVEKFLRWYRRNKRMFWVVTASVMMIAGVGGVLFREKLRELVTWRLLYEEQFNSPSLDSLSRSWQGYVSSNWSRMVADSGLSSGCWAVEGGRLIGRSRVAVANLSFTRPLSGDIRVEWDVTLLSSAENVNCFIAGATRFDGYCLHVGGFGLYSSVTLTRGKSVEFMTRAHLPVTLEVNHTYRFRLEKEGKTVRFFENGHRVFAYRDPDAFSGPGHQTFGFEVNNGNMFAYDNVRVYHHPLPLKVSPVATPDDYREQGNLARALVLYRQIAHTYDGSADAAEALFKSARCLRDLDSPLVALTAFHQFETQYPRNELVPLSLYERSKMLRAMGDTAAVMRLYDELARRYKGNPVLRGALLDLSSAARTVLDSATPYLGMDPRTPAMLQRLDDERKLVQHWAHRFGTDMSDDPFLVALAKTLIGSSVGRSADKVLAVLPDQRSAITGELENSGAVEWLDKHMPDQSARAVTPLHATGAYLEMLHRFPRDDRACAQALYELGRYTEVLHTYPHVRPEASMSLVRLGRYEDALRDYPDQSAACAAALFRLGRYKECAQSYPGDTSYGFRSAWLSGTVPALLRSAQTNQDMRIALYRSSLRWDAEAVREYELHGIAWTISGNYEYEGALTEIGRPEEGAKHVISPDALAYTLLCRGLTDSLLSLAGNNVVVLRLARLDRGDYAEVLQEDVMTSMDMESLLQSGRVDELLARFPLRRTAGADMLLWAGRYEEVLARFRDQRRECAQALVALGRYDEVYRDYPDCWRQCNDALLRQGRFDESRKRFPEFREEYTRALLTAGRYREVADSSEDRPRERGIARLRLGRYDDALAPSFVRPLLVERSEVMDHLALSLWMSGEHAKADAAFAAPRTFYLDQAWWHLRFERFLLQPVLHALAGDKAALDSACARIMRDHPTHCARQLWNEAAWLSGAINDQQFLNQPRGRCVQDRLVFLKAVKADIDGRTEDARAGYESCRVLPHYPPTPTPWDIFESWTVRAFIEWRATQLKPTSGS